MEHQPSVPAVSLGELTRESFKIGCLGFGGPAGQIALMHRILVDERKWIDDARYMHALNYCMLLPGPEAQQLAIYVGWLMRGVIGGLIAGVLFVLPGAFVILALSWLYAAHADAPAVAALFYGVKAAVIAIVAEAVVKIGKRALKARLDAVIAAFSFLALFVIGAPFPLVILAAAVFGFARAAPAVVDVPLASGPAPSSRGAFVAAVAAAALWLAPVAAAALLLGNDHVLTQVGFLFSKLAVVTFGGAYAVLAYLQQQAVDAQQWLTAAQMIDGLGLADTTPGPLVLVNQYVGFMAGWNSGGAWLAVAAAMMASWCTFAPSFLWIYAGAPYAEKLRENRRVAGALRAVTAAVLGVVVSLALWFSLHVLFAQTAPLMAPWGHTLQMPALATFDPFATVLALAAGVALIRFKTNMLIVIAACAGAGLLRLAVL